MKFNLRLSYRASRQIQRLKAVSIVARTTRIALFYTIRLSILARKPARFFPSSNPCTLPRGYTGFLDLSLAGCTSDKDCPLTTACIAGTCQEPCLVRNPCVKNAICVNTNHRAECSCDDGYHGNGFLYCALGNCIARADP